MWCPQHTSLTLETYSLPSTQFEGKEYVSNVKLVCCGHHKTLIESCNVKFYEIPHEIKAEILILQEI